MKPLDKIMGAMSSMAHTSKMTPEEWEKFKADDWNRTPGKLHEQDGYDCPLCLNRGDFCRAVQDARGKWWPHHSPCKCIETRNTIKRMKRSGLKDIIKDYTFGKFHATEPWQQTIKEAAEHYAKEPAGWFFIGGQSGSGKTHLCTAICREFLLAGRAVKYMLWRDDVVQIKQAVNDHEKYTDLIDQYKNVDVLYIDDLFKTGKAPDGTAQRPTVADINAAFEILNFRYNDPSKLTIISSECTINDILEIDEAVGGRIFERAKAFSLKPDRSRNYRLRGSIEL